MSYKKFDSSGVERMVAASDNGFNNTILLTLEFPKTFFQEPVDIITTSLH